MKKNSILLIMFISLFFIFDKNVFALCKDFGNSGSAACLAESEDGFKCEYNASRKGAARCFKGKTAVDVIVVEPSTSTPDTSTGGTGVDVSTTPSDGTTESDKACNMYASQGEDVCKSHSYDGYKCDWDVSKKGGARCFKSKNLSDEKISEIGSTVNSCSEIKEGSEVCNKTKINGIQCFYSHGVCANETDSDGTGETIVDGTVVKAGTTTVKTTANTASYDTGCPLGVDVTKDIYGLLKILKIAAPLLVVGLTIFEFVKAIARSEIDGEAKKLGMRLVKRLIIAVILFFLPVLVNQIMIMANIWDENGTCDFSKSADQVDSSKSEGVVTNITTTTTTTTTRSVYIDPGHTSPSGAEHGGGGSRR